MRYTLNTDYMAVDDEEGKVRQDFKVSVCLESHDGFTQDYLKDILTEVSQLTTRIFEEM